MQSIDKNGVYGDVEPLDLKKMMDSLISGEVSAYEIYSPSEIEEARKRAGIKKDSGKEKRKEIRRNKRVATIDSVF